MSLQARISPVKFPCGDARSVSIPVLHGGGGAADLTGWSAEWTLGIVDGPAALGAFFAATGEAMEPQVCILKASGANLDIVTVGGASSIRFDLVYSDTVSLSPRLYWQQAVAIDPQGNPYTVAEGIVQLTPSLRAVRASSASALPLSPVVEDSFAIWQGDDTPPKVWSFGVPSNLADLTGSVFELMVTGLAAPTATYTVRSDDPGAVLSVDTSAQTVTWAYDKATSAAVEAAGTAYQLHRLIAGTRQLWTHGQVVGRAP